MKCYAHLRFGYILAGAMLCIGAAPSFGGIPQPDVLLYGSVSIAGQPVTAEDDVTVIARVTGVQNPVGLYRIGQSSAAGNNYVLRIRLESGADGSTQSDDAARVGQTAQIYVKQGAGIEELMMSVELSAPGSVEQHTLGTGCADTIRPTLVHTAEDAGEGPASTPCSGYIDPRFDSDNGTDVNLCFTSQVDGAFMPQEIVMVFSERVRNAGSGSGDALTAEAFSVAQTGGGAAPAIANISTTMNGERQVVTLTLDGPITVQEWTTVIAGVEDLCGNPIASNGNVGPGIDESDRIDIGCLPGDVNQSGNTSPFDLIRAKQKILGTCTSGCPECSGEVAGYDISRNGSFSVLDLVRLKQLFLNAGNSTRNWNGQQMNQLRP